MNKNQFALIFVVIICAIIFIFKISNEKCIDGLCIKVMRKKINKNEYPINIYARDRLSFDSNILIKGSIYSFVFKCNENILVYSDGDMVSHGDLRGVKILYRGDQPYKLDKVFNLLCSPMGEVFVMDIPARQVAVVDY